jgi:predicted peptidase
LNEESIKIPKINKNKFGLKKKNQKLKFSSTTSTSSFSSSSSTASPNSQSSNYSINSLSPTPPTTIPPTTIPTTTTTTRIKKQKQELNNNKQELNQTNKKKKRKKKSNKNLSLTEKRKQRQKNKLNVNNNFKISSKSNQEELLGDLNNNNNNLIKSKISNSNSNNINGSELNMWMIKPSDFDPNKKYPLVYFLHGRGESGTDNEKQLVHGSKLFLNEVNQNQFPAIVVFPQCPKNDYWAKAEVDRSETGNTFKFDYSGEPNPALKKVISLLDSLQSHKNVNADKIYLGGLSMGGMGTFELLHRRPETFAAAIAICGAGDPKSVSNYAKNVDLWVFHGAKDDVVAPEYSKEMVEALKNDKANVKFTLYPNANHNSWDPAFAEPELLTWLFSNSK